MRWFDEQIHSTAWAQTKFLRWFAGAPGTKVLQDGRTVDGPMIKKVEEGMEEIITTKFEKMKPGQIAGSPQEAPKQVINLSDSADPLMSLVTKIAIPFNKVDAWRNNKFIKAGEMPQQVLSKVMLPLANQVDQFLCYGDDFLTPLAFDRLSGVGKYTGLFNGFTSFSGGDGADDKMGTKGDYISTYVNGRSLLRIAGFDKGPFYVLSDEATQSNAEKGAHRYTTGTRPVTAYSSFMGEYKFRQGEVADWINSINAYPASDTDGSRWCLTQPFISQQGKRIEAAYVLYVSYDFKVLNLYNGGLSANGEYEWLIYWQGRLHSFNDEALVRTGATLGALDLTGV